MGCRAPGWGNLARGSHFDRRERSHNPLTSANRMLTEIWKTNAKMILHERLASRPGKFARALSSLRRFPILLVIVFVTFGGCQTVHETIGHRGPVIEFTSVPIAGADNPEKLSSIRGRVLGGQASQQIVLYAR